MVVTWMLYCTAVSVLLGTGALAAELRRPLLSAGPAASAWGGADLHLPAWGAATLVLLARAAPAAPPQDP